MQCLAARVGVVLLAASLVVTWGCASSPAMKFYILTSGAGTEATEEVLGGPSLGVGPIEIPGYLNRVQIVRRTGENRIEVAEFHRWGESLGAGVSRVLAKNLAALLSSERVVTFPWDRSERIDYQIRVRINRFERLAGGDVFLQAVWSVIGRRGGKPLLSLQSGIREPTVGDSYHATVSAMGASLDTLSREIATAIQGL